MSGVGGVGKVLNGVRRGVAARSSLKLYELWRDMAFQKAAFNAAIFYIKNVNISHNYRFI